MALPRSATFAIRLLLLLGALVGAVAVGFTAQAWWRHPDLSPWHTTRLANEFKAGAAAPRTLPEYQAQEARLFAELCERIYALPLASGEVNDLEHHSAGSLVARIALDTDGNRTHELGHAAPRGAAGMLHGLTDSLGHLAMPMPMDDPIYGLTPRHSPDDIALPLGQGVPHCEACVLLTPCAQFGRVRSNPFFPLIVQRIDAAVQADVAP